jgi:hypothetical protein
VRILKKEGSTNKTQEQDKRKEKRRSHHDRKKEKRKKGMRGRVSEWSLFQITEHLIPPPWLTQLPPLPWANLLQPGTSHLRPPPCWRQRPLLSGALRAHSG